MTTELKASAERLLVAAMEYWEEYRKSCGGAAVVYVTDEAGRMVLLTRGEYRETLMANMDQVRGVLSFEHDTREC